MLAIYKKELRSYFCGMIGCIMSAVILAFIGFFTVTLNIAGGDAHFEYAIYYAVVFFAFVITVPFITMRSIAEERHSKTEQLLLSLPVPIYKTVLAKYFAMLTLICTPVAVTSLYPLVLKAFDTDGIVNLATAYNAVFMLVLLLSAMVAIGMFASSLVENQIIAAVITVGIFFILYFMTTLAALFPTAPIASLIALILVAVVLGVIVLTVTKNSTAACIATGVPAAACIAVYIFNSSLFGGLFPSMLARLAFFDIYAFGAYTGVLDITAVVYYVSAAALFVFITVENMERRRDH